MIPLALSVTVDATSSRRAAIVNQAILVAAAVILVMGIIGKPLLESLGITLPAFTIAGGALLFLIAVDMLFGRKTGTKQTPEEERADAESSNPAVFPLAVCRMIAGPGTDRDRPRLGDAGRQRPGKGRDRLRGVCERDARHVDLYAPLHPTAARHRHHRYPQS